MPTTHDLRSVFTQYARVPKDAPVFQLGETRETEGQYRVGVSVVVKLPLKHESRWFGLRLSWLSMQVKLPFGRLMEKSRHGLAFGRWTSRVDDEWVALSKAVHMGHEWTVEDEREFTDPEFEGSNEDRGIGIVDRRRVDAGGHAGADR